MIKCNNPKCGFESQWQNRIRLCPKCGFVMHVIDEKINKALKQKGTIDRGSFAKYAEEAEDIDGDK